MSKRKKTIINFVFFFGMIALVLYMLLRGNDIGEMFEKLKSFKLEFLCLSLLALFIYLFFDIIILKRITKKYTTKKVKLSSVSLSANFYNGITPFASGGQPVQIFYMNKFGINPSKSTTILLMRFLIYQASITLLSLVAIIKYYDVLMKMDGMQTLIIVGFSITAFVLLVIVGLAFSKKVSNIIKAIFRLLGKIKLFKNKMESLEKKTDDFVREFQGESKAFFRDYKLVITISLLTVFRLIAFYSITYFILMGLNLTDMLDKFVLVVAFTSFAFAVTAFVPTPGASGGAEYAFNVLFAAYVSGGTAIAGILIWRFFTYYIPLLLGFGAAMKLKRDADKIEKKKQFQKSKQIVNNI